MQRLRLAAVYALLLLLSVSLHARAAYVSDVASASHDDYIPAIESGSSWDVSSWTPAADSWADSPFSSPATTSFSLEEELEERHRAFSILALTGATGAAGPFSSSSSSSSSGSFIAPSSSSTGSANSRVVDALTVAFIVAPPSVRKGSQLQLAADVSPSMPASGASRVFLWRCVSHPTLLPSLWDAERTVFAPVNASSLTLRAEALQQLPADSYVFAVDVFDSVASASSSLDLYATGSAQTSVSVLPALVLLVNVTASQPNPCASEAGMSLCKNGGVCISNLDPSSTAGNQVYSLSCRCPTSFFGLSCELGVLSCPNCLARFVGGDVVSVYGIALDSLYGIKVAGRVASFSRAENVDATSADEEGASMLRQYASFADKLQVIRFITPALVVRRNTTTVSSGSVLMSNLFPPQRALLEDAPASVNPPSSYKVLTVQSSLPGVSSGGNGALEVNFTTMLYYSSSSCGVGVFREDGAGDCLPCPVGAYCPGAGRAWPLAGYWSYSEYQAPLRCTIPESCLGVNIQSPDSVTAGGSGGVTNFAVNTQQCSAEYTGAGCQSCSEGYYKLNSRCYFCGSSVDQTRQIVLTIIAALVAMAFLSILVALLAPRPLAVAMQMFAILQGIALVGVDGAKNSPYYREKLSEAAVYINLVNFDIELLKPGCGGVPAFDYVTKVQATLVFMLVAATMFVLACVLRFCIHTRRLERDEAQQQKSVAVATITRAEEEQKEAIEAREVGRDGGDQVTKPGPMESSLASNEAQASVRPHVDFRQRIQHSLLILLSIFYLRITILMFKAFVCESAPDPVLDVSASDAIVTRSLYLSEDLQTRCYTGQHLATAIGASILLLVYTLGFPLLCFVLLMRAFATEHTTGLLGWLRRTYPALLQGQDSRRNSGTIHPDMYAADAPPRGASPRRNGWGEDDAAQQQDVAAEAKQRAVSLTLESIHIRIQQERDARIGFLYLGFRSGAFLGILLLFAMHIFFSCVTVFGPEDGSSVFKQWLFGMARITQAALVATFLPYARWLSNAQNIGVALGTVAYSAVLLAIQHDGLKSAYFFVLITGCGLVIVGIFSREYLTKCIPCLITRKGLAQSVAAGEERPMEKGVDAPQEEQQQREASSVLRVRTDHDEDEIDDGHMHGKKDPKSSPHSQDSQDMHNVQRFPVASPTVVDDDDRERRTQQVRDAIAAEEERQEEEQRVAEEEERGRALEAASRRAAEALREQQAASAAAAQRAAAAAAAINAAELRAEEARLAAIAEESARQATRAVSMELCALPLPMVTRVCEQMLENLVHTKAQFVSFVARAFTQYEQAASECPDAMRAANRKAEAQAQGSQRRVDAAVSAAAAHPQLAEVSAAAPAHPLTPELQQAVIAFTETQVREWRQCVEQLSSDASASLSFDSASTVALQSALRVLRHRTASSGGTGSQAEQQKKQAALHAQCVSELAAHPALVPVLVRMAAECTASEKLWSAVDEQQREAQKLQEQQSLREAASKVVAPSALEAALQGIDVSEWSAESQDADDSAAVLSPALLQALQTVREAAAGVLGADAVSEGSLSAQLNPDDAATLAKLQQWKSASLQRVLAVAAHDSSLLAAIVSDAQAQADRLQREEDRLRGEAAAAQVEQRRAQAQKDVASMRQQARASVMLQGLGGRRVLVPMNISGAGVDTRRMSLMMAGDGIQAGPALMDQRRRQSLIGAAGGHAPAVISEHDARKRMSITAVHVPPQASIAVAEAAAARRTPPPRSPIDD